MNTLTTITRRTALAGAAALPGAALAASVSLPLAQPADPVVITFAEWKALDRERTRVTAVFNDLEERHGPVSEPVRAYDAETVAPVYTRLGAVEHRIAEMVATTPAGLAAQARIALERFGLDGESGMEEIEGRLLRSMLDGAEGMAGVAS